MEHIIPTPRRLNWEPESFNNVFELETKREQDSIGKVGNVQLGLGNNFTSTAVPETSLRNKAENQGRVEMGNQ